MVHIDRINNVQKAMDSLSRNMKEIHSSVEYITKEIDEVLLDYKRSVEMTLRLERTIHKLIKETEKERIPLVNKGADSV